MPQDVVTRLELDAHVQQVREEARQVHQEMVACNT